MPEITEAQALWGAALMFDRKYGSAAPAKVAERVAELANAGDEVGCALWRDIADKLEQLPSGGTRH